MRYLYFILIFTLLVSCQKEKTHNHKKTVSKSALKINDSLSYTIEFIKKEGRKYGAYYSARAGLEQHDFNKTIGFLKGYDPAKIYGIILFFEVDLYQKEIPEITETKAYLIYYADKDNYLTADYINPIAGIKESYRVRTTWCDVIEHYLFNSGIKNKHTATIIVNKSLDPSKVKTVRKSEDETYKRYVNHNNSSL